MEPSAADSWLNNFEMNYSSFLQDFEQFDVLAPSPMIPDTPYISPDQCCLSNSNLDPIPSLEVNTTSPPPKNNISNVVTNQAKKKKKPRSKSWNCGFTKKERKGTNEQGFDKSNGTGNLNDSTSNAHSGRKRSYEVTTDVDSVKNSRSLPDPVIQLALPKKGHIMAERRRREKLTQRFIALSSIIPGLTRMDKASVLEDAIKYVKQLQEKMKTLETQGTQNTVQAAVIVKKSQSLPDECNSSTCDNNSLDNGFLTKAGSLPEIEVRFSQQRVLIKIHCQSHRGVLVKVLSEIESLGLKIISTTVVPFTSSSLDITVTAKVDEKLALTIEDLVKRLNFSVEQL